MPGTALEERFEVYVDALAHALAHAERKKPFAAYCRGLLLPPASARASSRWRPGSGPSG